MLHIHSGDSAANIAKQSSLPGDHFAWREALVEGPTPANATGDEWRKLRARHLVEFYGTDPNETESELQSQEKALASYSDHDEVVLWFEHDLFCQINLLYLLNWFAQRELDRVRLSLIFIGEFPSLPNFRGLGELNAEQMASLFAKRHEVSSGEFDLATTAWRAYCSPDPTALEALLTSDTSQMPFLKHAVRLHLERFPFVRNGLGRIQNRGLRIISGGLNKFTDVFRRFGDREPAYGLGDAQFWTGLKRMSDAPQPLLKIINGSTSEMNITADKIHHTAFEITQAGAEVLNGEADFVEMNGINVWLGGVHLEGKSDLWRWDERNEKLTYT